MHCAVDGSTSLDIAAQFPRCPRRRLTEALDLFDERKQAFEGELPAGEWHAGGGLFRLSLGTWRQPSGRANAVVRHHRS